MPRIKKNDILKIINHEVKRCVSAYLLAQAHAKVLRETVDKVHYDILTQCPIYADKLAARGGVAPQILDHNKLYLCTNKFLLQDFYDEADHRLKKLHIKPDNMAHDFCPALVAEELQTQAENLLIESAGEPLGITNEKLLRCRDGLARRQEFIDLVTGLIIRQTDFKNPTPQPRTVPQAYLTGK